MVAYFLTLLNAKKAANPTIAKAATMRIAVFMAASKAELLI